MAEALALSGLAEAFDGAAPVPAHPEGEIMTSAWVAAGVSALFVGVPTLAAAGEKVDMAELTCQQFLADEEAIRADLEG